MKNHLKALLLSLTMTLCAAHATAGTIGFDDITTRNNFDNMGISSSYLGYTWSSSGVTGEGWATATTSNTISGAMSAPVSGSTIAWNWNGVQSLYVNFGKAMDVSGAWFATGYSGGNATSVTMYGYDALHNLIFTSASIAPTFTFQYLSANFTGVYSLELRANSSNAWFAVDSIGVSAANVPEPASIALLALGLAGVALLRRKQA